MPDNIFFFKQSEFLAEMRLLKTKNVAVLINKTAAKRFGLLDYLEENNNVIWVDKIDANPNQYTVFEALQKCLGRRPETIVAIGGGSAIDLAKALSALISFAPLHSAQDVMQCIINKTYLQKTPSENIAIIAVPTTAGTGSEVTQWATVWDKDEKKKYSVQAPWLMPQKAWIVPELTLSLPANLTLATGLDALCQAAEAYWAKQSDPLAKELALQSTRIIYKTLPKAVNNLQNLEYRKKMCTGSLLAGLAFSRTRTTACHSISYPITAQFNVPHGFAVALTLAPIARINSEAVNCAELFDILGTPCEIQKWIDTLCHGQQIMRLSAFGITAEDLPLLANNAFTAGRMDNNPVNLDVGDVVAILQEII